MRFLEDDVIVGDKLIPFLVANDVFELVPEKATSNVLQTFQTQWNYDKICINDDMIKVKLPEDSFPPSSLFVSIVAFFFLSEESTTLARVGDSSVITMSSLCQCIVSILAKHLARSWPETLSFTLVRWRKCFGFRGRVNTDFEVCSLVSLSVITSCFATECFSIYEKFTNWLWTYLSDSYLSYYYNKSKKVIVEFYPLSIDEPGEVCCRKRVVHITGHAQCISNSISWLKSKYLWPVLWFYCYVNI